ncbi:MAG: 50S ribosomal protein L22 [Firmicutes bacterium]|nr:50S ribosomal protein L22 [Bacillota bacterium]
MEARAIARYIRLAPTKTRLIIDLIRGKGVQEALSILRYTPRRAARVVEKLVKSAAANAENNHNMAVDRLIVAEAFVDQGPSLKRIWARGRGVRNVILHRTSHITVVLREKGEG